MLNGSLDLGIMVVLPWVDWVFDVLAVTWFWISALAGRDLVS
jgi:hypothetical protein